MTRRIIPAGREELYRRQAAADAEVERLDAELTAAQNRAQDAYETWGPATRAPPKLTLRLTRR